MWFKTIAHLFSFFLLAFFFSACSNTKYLKKNESLVKKNTIDFKTTTPTEEEEDVLDDLEDLIAQQPNAKSLFLFKLRLYVYNKLSYKNNGDPKNLGPLSNWLIEKAGEPPVVYDEKEAEKAAEFMEGYLFNRGFFYADVKSDTTVKRHRAEIDYFVNAGPQYRISEVFNPEDTTDLMKLLNAHQSETYLKSGEPFNSGKMSKERDRLADVLRDQGYYYFNKQFVTFDIDSNKINAIDSTSNYLLDVYMRINPQDDSTQHVPYTIGEIYINPDFRPDDPSSSIFVDTIHADGFHLLLNDPKPKFRERIFSDVITLKSNTLYSRTEYFRTVRKLTQLGGFRFISVRYLDNEYGNSDILDVMILLTPSKKQEITQEIEANHQSNYDLGLAVSYTYKNKNVFKTADQFAFNMSAGLEMDFDTIPETKTFNTIDISGQVNFYFHKFIPDFKWKVLQHYLEDRNTKSKLSFGYNYLRRIQYYTMNSFSYSFAWETTKGNVRTILSPLTVSLVTFTDQTIVFEELLDSNPVLRHSFNQQLIVSFFHHTRTWSDYKGKRDKMLLWLRTDFETAGILVDQVYSFVSSDEGPEREIFNIPYSEYWRGDIDFRTNFIFSEKHSFVVRGEVGVGWAFGNSYQLPYVKQFFSGGSNSLRGWRARTLGPGSYNNTDTTTIFVDESGDIKIEMNLEYRFNIFSIFKGALFADAGNVWLRKPNPAKPGGEFDFATFTDQFGVDIGAGLRLDFDFFILRFDLATPIRDPSLTTNNKWIVNQIRPFKFKWLRNNVVLNLAIGYPF